MPAVALTIAGSDPSGGAGIQADLKTFHQFGIYGQAAITLLTVQNTRRVSRVEVLSAGLVVEQIQAVLEDTSPAAAKTGALGSRDVVEAVAEIAKSFSFPLVVDPVTISKHGARLMAPAAEEALRSKLLPLAYLVTPNVPEAEALARMAIRDGSDMRAAAHRIQAMGCQAVLIKAGHLAEEEEADDLLLAGNDFTVLSGKRVKTRHTHGTGCTYSAAITANLALGLDLRSAAAQAKSFVQRAIETAPGLGAGHGPVNHFARL